MKVNILKSVVAGLLATTALVGVAQAGSVTQPGETVGQALGAPLPEGVYFVNTGSIGRRSGAEMGVNIPVLAWSTPWTVGGGRVALLGAAPELYVGSHSGSSFSSGMYNPFLAGMISWDLGGGFGVSYLAGAYFGINGGDFKSAFDQNTFRQDLHLSYSNNGWTASANLIYGIVGKNDTTGDRNPDYFNYDLALTNSFGKWEFGVVGFGSTDLNKVSPRQSQFAAGGLVGYNFGPVIAQAYVTTDLSQTGYGGKETRSWLRLIVPLWNPPATPAAAAVQRPAVRKG